MRAKTTLAVWPDTANILGISRNAAYEGVANGTIPALRFGRTIRVPVAKLLAMLGETTSGPAA